MATDIRCSIYLRRNPRRSMLLYLNMWFSAVCLLDSWQFVWRDTRCSTGLLTKFRFPSFGFPPEATLNLAGGFVGFPGIPGPKFRKRVRNERQMCSWIIYVFVVARRRGIPPELKGSTRASPKWWIFAEFSTKYMIFIRNWVEGWGSQQMSCKIVENRHKFDTPFEFLLGSTG